MVTVTGVKFKTAGKVYYFDPDKFDVKVGDNVIVETARGLEFGTITMEKTDVKDSDIVSPLKKIIRIATPEDEKKHEENEKKKERSLALCEEKIKARGLEMKLIDVEYTFDDTKVIFYFTADGRIDFRELVKDLAAIFKMRIELRQIGVRDEAKMIGGIGTCGRPLCCNSWLSDFEPVSIKMAKVQSLSLNPTKISGICGRLMCCLKYENDIYFELKKGMPEVGEKIKTPDGMAKVVDTNLFRDEIKVRLYLDEPQKVRKNGEEEDEDDKLSSDTYIYSKEEIKRIEKRYREEKDILSDLDKEELEELKKIISE